MNKFNINKYFYEQTLIHRDRMNLRNNQLITLFTASVTCWVWDVSQVIEKFNQLYTLQIIILSICLFTAAIFLGICAWKYYSGMERNVTTYIDLDAVKDLLKDDSSNETSEMSTLTYNSLSDSFQKCAIENEEHNIDWAKIQRKIMNMVFSSFGLCALSFIILAIKKNVE